MARTRTNKTTGTAEGIANEGARAAKKAAYSPAMDALIRLGYAVRGVLYVTIGAIAFQAATGKATSPTDQFGAIAKLGQLPSGRTILWVILVGLAAYALWGLIRAILDPFQKGTDRNGLAARAGYFISAISYAYFAYTTYRLLKGTASGGSGQTIPFIATLMQSPAGRLLVALIGIGVLLAGLYQIYQGITMNFEQRFKPYAMTADERRTAMQMGKIGYAVRGLVIGIIGALLLLAATSADPSKARGLSGALDFLGHQTFGLWVLGVVAAGLIFLGIYSLMAAAWFRIRR
jgi:hypothetical protein